MVLNGKTYQNLMVDDMQTNQKLVTRAKNNAMEVTGENRETATKYLELAHSCSKVAICMLINQLEYLKALELLI